MKHAEIITPLINDLGLISPREHGLKVLRKGHPIDVMCDKYNLTAKQLHRLIDSISTMLKLHIHYSRGCNLSDSVYMIYNSPDCPFYIYRNNAEH